MKEMAQLPALLLPPNRREELLACLRSSLGTEEFERVRVVFEGAAQLLEAMEQKRLSIARLCNVIFGAKTETGHKVCMRPPKDPKRQGQRRRGHGRLSHQEYTGAERRRVNHPTLKPGQKCPKCGRGKLRRQKEPATTVQLKAQPPVGALVHEMERLRCDTCGEIHTAPRPPEATGPKFDPSVGVMVGLLRFGCGMPHYRLARLQDSVGVPLPESVQWEQAHQVAIVLMPVVKQLLVLGAQAELFHNDDTPMRIAGVREEIEAEQKPGRTGIFTTGIVCETAGKPPILMVFTGRNHAGENLGRVLKERAAGLEKPMQMCDGLKRNEPTDHPTELCHCLAHARRRFVEIRGDFQAECDRVIESLGEVYRVDAECRAEGVGREERLRRHQTRSGPVLEGLRAEFEARMAQRKVEPNSALGGAMNYMLERWESLTRFLRVGGAPLDNNASERLLKTSILHRKNSLHYKTQRGAEVGDVFMTVTGTCRANGVNPFDYMMAVVRNAEAVAGDQGRWLPWNYLKALEAGEAPKADAPGSAPQPATMT